jgi:ribonuclease BN (tRNA processing enzyme)
MKRAEPAAGSLVFSTDTEPPDEGLDERLVDFMRGAGLVIYDAMYTPGEYAAGKKGWGHSTWLEAVKTARAAGAGRLLLSHFNPDHDDAAVDEIARLAAAAFPGAAAARQGMMIAW